MRESESNRYTSDLAAMWEFDRTVAMINHGSFGACPRAVLQAQQRYREQMEREPVRFFTREREPLLDAARQALAEFLHAEPADLVFVRNATEGVNCVLRSLVFEPGDELLVTDHGYNACRNVVDYVAGRNGARVVLARIPMPIRSPHEAVEAILAATTARTRLALIDHITSSTALVLPIEQIVAELVARGVDTLVDGAHGPGMLPLHLDRIGAACYAGNCHKWMCCPKGAGFLHVRRDHQAPIHPVVISHGYNTIRPDRGRFHEEFDWSGTGDPTAWLCLPEAIRFLGSLVEGGVEGLMRHNRRLAIAGRKLLCEAVGTEPPCPEEMLGAIAAIQLGPDEAVEVDALHTHPLHDRLLDEFRIDVPVYHWPTPPHLWLRISAQAYNSIDQYGRLADALKTIH
ncbi:MAG: aminotransferase class V-fold PLP-dependent enzyme [Thermoguttaceae bacterium]